MGIQKWRSITPCLLPKPLNRAGNAPKKELNLPGILITTTKRATRESVFRNDLHPCGFRAVGGFILFVVFLICKRGKNFIVFLLGGSTPPRQAALLPWKNNFIFWMFHFGTVPAHGKLANVYKSGAFLFLYLEKRSQAKLWYLKKVISAFNLGWWRN